MIVFLRQYKIGLGGSSMSMWAIYTENPFERNKTLAFRFALSGQCWQRFANKLRTAQFQLSTTGFKKLVWFGVYLCGVYQSGVYQFGVYQSGV